MPSRRTAVLIVLEGIVGVFGALLLFGAFEVAFGSIGFLFAMLTILVIFAFVILAHSIRQKESRRGKKGRALAFPG